MLLTTKRIIFFPLIFLGLFVFLSKVFSGALILPQAFNLGSISIHYYGIIMALAVFSAYYVAVKRAPIYELNKKQAEDIMFWTVIGGFLGARVYHILSSAGYYLQNPIDAVKVWQGGLSIYGAFFGGLIVLLFVAKILNLKSSILNLLNWLTPSLILGQIIGRFGNLFNYEAFGYPTTLPWKMFVPINFRPVEFINESYFHPFFLYEVLGNVVILLIIWYLSNPSTRRPLDAKQNPWPSVGGFTTPLPRAFNIQANLRGGSLFFFYILLYNILRFILENFRVDSVFLGHFRLNSLVSLFLVLVSFVFLFYRTKNDKVS